VRIAIACGLLFVAIVSLPPAAIAQFAEKKVLTLEVARTVVTAAEAEAARTHLAGVLQLTPVFGRRNSRESAKCARERTRVAKAGLHPDSSHGERRPL
jgi:hypothetical protein